MLLQKQEKIGNWINYRQLKGNQLDKNLPVITSMSQVIATTSELLIPEAANVSAWGKSHRSEVEALDFVNIRISVLVEAFEVAFPCWKRNGVPWSSGVFGCHLCCAIWAAGALISTIMRESEEAYIREAGRLQRSGDGTMYAWTSVGFRKMVYIHKFRSRLCFELYAITLSTWTKS